jgi:steroid 5-alpha reductase family enzyme
LIFFGTASFHVGDFLLVSATAALVVVLLMTAVLVVSRRTGRIVVVDTAWGLGFIAVALVSAVLGQVIRDHRTYLFAGAYTGEDDVTRAFRHYMHQADLRSWGILVLVTIWGGRLALHIFRRSRGGGEDPRYEELMGRGGGGIVRKVLVPQGVAMWFVSIPVQMAAVVDGYIGIVAWLGVALWAVGLLFETVGDAQLSAYRREPKESRPPVMDRGLWRFTRHPNYFGDACVWWGIWLVVADVWPGVLTALSPLVMTFFLLFATGAKLLEKTMMQRPGYPEYAARTSMFFPLPPKRATPRSAG